MKESELKEHERIALNCYRLFEKQKKDGMLSKTSKTGALYKFGKEIAEKLEPELKPVDMSALVNSGIDCVFSDTDIGELSGIEPSCYYAYENARNGSRHSTAKPRMKYWFSAENFENPEGLVEKLERSGFGVSKKLYGTMRDLKLQSFMIKGLQDGYCWPWEVE